MVHKIINYDKLHSLQKIADYISNSCRKLRSCELVEVGCFQVVNVPLFRLSSRPRSDRDWQVYQEKCRCAPYPSDGHFSACGIRTLDSTHTCAVANAPLEPSHWVQKEK